MANKPNPRRLDKSPIRVEPGTDTDKNKTTKAFANTQEFTYSKSEDYRQKKILGLDTTEPLLQSDAIADKKLMEALHKDLNDRNLHH